MILATAILDPEFDAIWDLASRWVLPLEEIGRIVLVEPDLAVELGITASSFTLLDPDTFGTLW